MCVKSSDINADPPWLEPYTILGTFYTPNWFPFIKSCNVLQMFRLYIIYLSLPGASLVKKLDLANMSPEYK